MQAWERVTPAEADTSDAIAPDGNFSTASITAFEGRCSDISSYEIIRRMSTKVHQRSIGRTRERDKITLDILNTDAQIEHGSTPFPLRSQPVFLKLDKLFYSRPARRSVFHVGRSPMQAFHQPLEPRELLRHQIFQPGKIEFGFFFVCGNSPLMRAGA